MSGTAVDPRTDLSFQKAFIFDFGDEFPIIVAFKRVVFGDNFNLEPIFRYRFSTQRFWFQYMLQQSFSTILPAAAFLQA